MTQLIVTYTTSLGGIRPEHLDGFFEDWPTRPTPERRLEILQAASRVVLALDPETETVIGFITAIADELSAAFIPLLEVLPQWRGRGIGSELVRRMLAELRGIYAIDLATDPDIAPFYERPGAFQLTGMAWRDRASLRD